MRWSVRSLALAQVVLVLAACSAVPGTSSTPSSSPAPTSTSEPSLVADSAPPPSVGPSASGLGDGVGLPAVGSIPIRTRALSATAFGCARSPRSPTTRRSSNRCSRTTSSRRARRPGPRFGLRLVPGPARRATSTRRLLSVRMGRGGQQGRGAVDRARDCRMPGATYRDHLHQSDQREWKDVLRGHMLRRTEAHVPREIRFARRDLPGRGAVDLGARVVGHVRGGTGLPHCGRGRRERLHTLPAWTPGIDLRMAPTSDGLRVDWPNVDVTGQFDHPAAQDCRNRNNFDAPDSPEPDPALTILNCRAKFVVTSMKEID